MTYPTTSLTAPPQKCHPQRRRSRVEEPAVAVVVVLAVAVVVAVAVVLAVVVAVAVVLAVVVAVVLASEIGPGFSPDIPNQNEAGLQPPGYALFSQPQFVLCGDPQ